MKPALTFTTESERLPTVLASLVFLLPGLSAVVVGVLTLAGLSWIDNASNGVLLVTTGGIWATVGLALFRFKRWIVVDPAAGTVVRGTRTLFKHPGERHPLDSFSWVEIQEQRVSDQVFYVVCLAWTPGKRPRNVGNDTSYWLQTVADLAEARTLGQTVSDTVSRPLVDRTRGERPSGAT